MIKNLFIITIRNFKKQLGFSMLNILGLTIGIASFILIFLWIMDELSYEKSYANADRIHVVYKEYSIGGNIQYNPATPIPLGPILKNKFPEIERMARVRRGWVDLKYGDVSFEEQRYCATDHDYLEMFELEFIAGNKQTAFSEPHSIILSENIAKRYFKDENPIGKVLDYGRGKMLTVDGVFKNPPEKTSFDFEILIRFDYVVENDGNRNDWGNHRYRTMIMVDPTVDMDELDRKMSDVIQENIPTEKIGVKTLALDKMRLHTIDGKNQRIQYIHLFMAIALFIILIACINFMNLSTARASRRSKEIGLRKVVGAKRSAIIVQFLNESILFSFISIVLAMMCVELLRPLFNQITDKHILIDYSEISVYGYLLAVALFTGILSGGYPAFLMSSFKPIIALKSTFNVGKQGLLFRKILVIIQFSISILLIISTLFVFLQLRHIQHKDLGFNKKNVIFFNAEGRIQNHFHAFKNEILKHKGVVNLSRATQLPNNIENLFRNVRWEGMEQDEGAAFGAAIIDFDYIETLKMEVIKGRSFSREYGRDSVNVMFNEKAIKMMGYEDPIGKNFTIHGQTGKIIGMVKDFNSMPLSYDIEPVIFVIWPDWCGMVLVRLNKSFEESAIAHIEKIYKEYVTDKPFSYEFLDHRIKQQYQSEQNIGTLSALFALIAIIISCLGLLGLSAHTAEQKTKEIGIRKVFGASIHSIVYKLCVSFTIWVIIANAVAWPIAYLIMKNWLQNFVSRIDLYWWVFALSGALALLIALLTVSFQVGRAGRNNPIDSLRCE